jgi:hypothetical protein
LKRQGLIGIMISVNPLFLEYVPFECMELRRFLNRKADFTELQPKMFCDMLDQAELSV